MIVKLNQGEARVPPWHSRHPRQNGSQHLSPPLGDQSWQPQSWPFAREPLLRQSKVWA